MKLVLFPENDLTWLELCRAAGISWRCRDDGAWTYAWVVCLAFVQPPGGETSRWFGDLLRALNNDADAQETIIAANALGGAQAVYDILTGDGRPFREEMRAAKWAQPTQFLHLKEGEKALVRLIPHRYGVGR